MVQYYIFYWPLLLLLFINVGLVIYIFYKNSQKNDNINEKNRKVSLLKTLVLDYSMKYFYQFFRRNNKET